MKLKNESITSFTASSYKAGKSQVVVIPKSKFDENILQKGKTYIFSVSEV